jgi:DNA adenine methylase
LNIIRYPGSKAKLDKFICRYFSPEKWLGLFNDPPNPYVEPFVGSGAIAWKVLPALGGGRTRVIINDIDPGIAELWRVTRDAPKELIRYIAGFDPLGDPDAFYRFKEQDGCPTLDPVRRAFQKLVLHQTSFSGLGFKAGGPLGGRDQSSEYNRACRWNPTRLAKNILDCHALMKRFRLEVSNKDFAEVLAPLQANAFVYLDPPYYVQGEALYKHSMTDADHARLAQQLRRAPYRWILSYDDCERVRELYSWATINTFTMTPTCATARTDKRRKNSEIVITNPD